MIRIVLIPWGNKAEKIKEMTPKRIEVFPSSSCKTLEGNRNKALSKLRESDKPDYVVFLDDDTFLNPSWIDSMKAESALKKGYNAFASVVFEEGWGKMQGQGHVFVNGAPRDRGFNGNNLKRKVLCPCGNSALIRWEALEKIWEEGDEVWDPLFKQDQTCFDFGLKLVLTGSKTIIVPGAVAQHRGYLCKDENWYKANSYKKVQSQLVSRYLLYKKFLPKDLEDAAVNAVNQRIRKWIDKGYPGFEKWIKGNIVRQIVEEARNCAEEKALNIKCTKWKNLMSSRKDAWNFLDLERKC